MKETMQETMERERAEAIAMLTRANSALSRIFNVEEGEGEATCKVCTSDFDVEDMIEDIQGAKYCLLDSGNICVVCGIYDHDCEGEDE